MNVHFSVFSLPKPKHSHRSCTTAFHLHEKYPRLLLKNNCSWSSNSYIYGRLWDSQYSIQLKKALCYPEQSSRGKLCTFLDAVVPTVSYFGLFYFTKKDTRKLLAISEHGREKHNFSLLFTLKLIFPPTQKSLCASWSLQSFQTYLHPSSWMLL